MRKALIISFVVAYSFGFTILEIVLLKFNFSSGAVAAISCSHNAISTMACAYIFWKCISGKSRWFWFFGFLLVGLADITHAMLFMMLPFTPNSILLNLNDKMYVLFASILAAAIFITSKHLFDRLGKAVIIVIGTIYCTTMILNISSQYWLSNPPLYEIVSDIFYDFTTSFIVATLVIKGLRDRRLCGFIFSSAILLVYFSDFAIRYFDSIVQKPTLSAFNYGWELGFSLIAVICLQLYFKKKSLRELFYVMPYNSIRFYMASISFIALSLFAVIFLLLTTNTELLKAVDLSKMLVIFLLSWTLANLASLWISSRLIILKNRILDNESATIGGSNVEIEDLLDIYRLKNRELGQAVNIIEGQKKSMDETLKYIAHDIRSPLSVLKTYICQPGSDDDDIKQCRSAASRSINKLLDMSSDLFDCARAGKIEKTRVKLVDFIRSFVAGSNVGLKVKVLYGDIPDITAEIDDYKIGRALVNILNNAIQATSEKEKGFVTVRAYSYKDIDLIIEVEDNGKGIEERNIERIFDIFFSSGKKGGTGLGLAYCKQVIEAHGGKINVESKIGDGTKFSIIIPNCVLTHNAEDTLLTRMSCETSTLTSLSSAMPAAFIEDKGNVYGNRNKIAVGDVLIADDDMDTRSQWIEIINSLGGTVACAATSPDELIAEGEFDFSSIDMAIVDYCYKGFSRTGIDIINFLKQKGIKHVYLCTEFYDDAIIRREAISAGARSIMLAGTQNRQLKGT